MTTDCPVGNHVYATYINASVPPTVICMRCSAGRFQDTKQHLGRRDWDNLHFPHIYSIQCHGICPPGRYSDKGGEWLGDTFLPIPHLLSCLNSSRMHELPV